MTSFRIVLKETLPAFRPGETLEGHVEWEGTEVPESPEVRLVWGLEGSGEEPEIARAETVETSAARGSQPFRWTLPDQPWSFEGKLFTIRWHVDVSRHGEPLARVAFILSPTGQALRPRG